MGFVLALAGGCVKDPDPVETGAMQSSGEECIAGTEGCPCIEGSCVNDLECFSNLCVDAGSTSAATTDPTTTSATTVATTPPMTSTTDETDGPLDTSVTGTTDGGVGQRCVPLAPDICSPGLACVGLDEEGFFCDVPGPVQQGYPCDESACEAGLWCVQENIIDCDETMSCCTAMCDIYGGSECPPGLVCEPFFPKGTEPPGYDYVGVCIMPV